MDSLNGNMAEAAEKNFRYTAQISAAGAEKRLAFLGELAERIAAAIRRETGCSDLVKAILSAEDGERIYRESLSSLVSDPVFGEVNEAEGRLFHRQLTRWDRLYLCRRLSAMEKRHPLTELIPHICGTLSPLPLEKDKKVAFLRNRQASRAFERFAKFLGGVSAVYEDNFRDACESVFSGRTTYAVIPIHNSSDGRLNGFYRLLEKYELSVVLSCEVDSDDGESSTVFALVYRERLYICTGGTPIYECKITFSDLTELADLADAASYFGATLRSVEALPLLFSGRANAFSILFGLENADVDGLFTYLALEYPQTAALCIYDRME